ncbi:hypothetical protein D3C72_1307640 [compost metagenome]
MYLGAEIAQRAQQLAHVFVGTAQKPRQLGQLQAGKAAVALEVDVLLQVLSDIVRRLHGQVERGLIVVGIVAVGISVCRGFGALGAALCILATGARCAAAASQQGGKNNKKRR